MLKVRDIMTRDIVAVAPEQTLREAMDLLASHHISGAPVVAGKKLLGIISATDLLATAAALPDVPVELPDDVDWGDSDDIEEPEAAQLLDELADEADELANESLEATSLAGPDPLDEHTVAEAMTSAVISVRPSATVLEVAELMRRNRIHRVFVIENDRLMGVISSMDIARAVAERKLSARTYVFARDPRGPGDRER